MRKLKMIRNDIINYLTSKDECTRKVYIHKYNGKTNMKLSDITNNIIENSLDKIID